MGKSVISKGKTVKEAVRTGLDLLGTPGSDVDIEILETETKGFLGFGSKAALVRLTVKDAQTEEQPQAALRPAQDTLEALVQAAAEQAGAMDLGAERLPAAGTDAPLAGGGDFASAAELAGKVWVKDGHIYCKNAPDKYPIVVPKAGVKFYKNDEFIEKTVVVNETDHLHVSVSDEICEPRWELSIGEDRLEAVLHVTPGYRLRRTLKDREPSNFIELDVVEQRLPIPIDSEAVLKEMKELGIGIGIDYTELARACGSGSSGTFVVARGIRPKPSANGYLESIKETEVKKGFRERADGSVDFRELQEFPAVERGQVIGIIHPPQSGEAGVAVTGEPVLPEPPQPLVIAEGKGIAIVDDTKVVATETGQPNVKINGRFAKISIVPKLTVPHDVNLKSGNVRYAGAVEILGAVQDGMEVEALGAVWIQGNANMANIASGSSISIRNNAITSELTAGKSSMLVQELHHMLGELHEHLERMAQAMQQIMNLAAFKSANVERTGLGPFLKILCDGKFKSVPPLVVAFMNKAKLGAEQLEDDWKLLGDKLFRNFVTPHQADLRTIAGFRELISQVGGLLRAAALAEADRNCFVKASYLQNCRVFSAGAIQVIGEGVYNSKLHAKGAVQIAGYIRGGEVFAEEGVVVQEAGTFGGIPTKIRVPKDRTITIGRVRADTFIQVGHRAHSFTEEASGIRARLADDGRLLLW